MKLWEKIMLAWIVIMGVFILWRHMNEERFDWSDTGVYGTFQPRDELIQLNEQ